MAIIREQRKLPSDWPEKDDIQALRTVSAPSFIVAATVCSHFQNHNLEPTQYLNEVVARLNEGPKVGEQPLAGHNRLFGAQTEYGPQPSANYGHDAGIESLHSIDVNSKDGDGSTPLITAAKHDHCDFVRYLLQNRKDLVINAQDKLGGTALGWAVESRSADTVRVLVSHPGVDVNIPTVHHQPLLHTAFDGAQGGVVRMLLERLDLNINALDKSNGYDISNFSRRWTILHLAARLGYTEVLRLLIDKFKDTLNVHARIAQGDTALHCAVSGASLEALQILLDETEIDIDATNENGMAALHLAAESGNLGAVRLLLEHGADVDIAENGGSTVEQFATSSGHTKVAELRRSRRRTQSMSLGKAE
ncbi:ankyrin repeat-containing domain protein [Aspergillus insuetus]